MIVLMLALPALAGVAAFFTRHDGARRALLVTAAIAHAALTAGCWWRRPAPLASGWLALDAAGLLFLTLTSAL